MKKKGEEIEIGKENPNPNPTRLPAYSNPGAAHSFFPLSPRPALPRSARAHGSQRSPASRAPSPSAQLASTHSPHAAQRPTPTFLSLSGPAARPFSLRTAACPARGPFPIFSCSARSPRAQPAPSRPRRPLSLRPRARMSAPSPSSRIRRSRTGLRPRSSAAISPALRSRARTPGNQPPYK